MPSTTLYGRLDAVLDFSDLLQKTDSVIRQFHPQPNPDVAPSQLCRLNSLLHRLNEYNIKLSAEDPQRINRLRGQLNECRAILERSTGGFTKYEESEYTWPRGAEAGLQALNNEIENEVDQINFYRPVQDGSTDQYTPISEPLSSLASTRASLVKEQQRTSLISNRLPVILKLRRNPQYDDCQAFYLETANIVDQDECSRTLQYQGPDRTITISHRVTRGQLPLVKGNDLHATKVTFMEPQTLVVQVNKEYKRYHNNVFLEYDFYRPQDLDQFIQKVRERALIGKFLPNRIYSNHKKRHPDATCKVVRIWEREHTNPMQTSSQQAPVEVTIIYEDKKLQQQRELHLDQYEPMPVLVESEGTVELRSLVKKDRKGKPESITFLFEKKDPMKVAKNFFDFITACHPQSRSRQRLQSMQHSVSFSDIGPSNAVAPSIAPSDASTFTTDLSTISPTTGPRTPESVPAEAHPPPMLCLPPPAMSPIITSQDNQSRGPRKPLTGTFPIITGASPTASPTLQPRTQGIQPSAPIRIAIICAMSFEADAIMAAFDHHWKAMKYERSAGDVNAYSFGSIGQQNVALIHLYKMGNVPAATAATNCFNTFPTIVMGVVVGVCGGVPVPPDREQIYLGDVVISEGVLQYDYGPQSTHGLWTKTAWYDDLPLPNPQMRALLGKLKTKHAKATLQEAALGHLRTMQNPTEYVQAAKYPVTARDVLYGSSYMHRQPGPTCLACDESQVVRKYVALEDKAPRAPNVHFGRVASGDIVLRSGEDRDSIAEMHADVISFEMEGAAVWNGFPSCVVIKGVCDYADSHKNKVFRPYAAATAAAYAKAFLEEWQAVN